MTHGVPFGATAQVVLFREMSVQVHRFTTEEQCLNVAADAMSALKEVKMVLVRAGGMQWWWKRGVR